MVRYAFRVRLFHSLLHAGLSRRCPDGSVCPTFTRKDVCLGGAGAFAWRFRLPTDFLTPSYILRSRLNTRPQRCSLLSRDRQGAESSEWPEPYTTGFRVIEN